MLVGRLIVFPAVELLFWRYLRRPYLALQSGLNRGWWMFAATGAVYYLLIMFTSVPVGAPMPDAAGLIRILLVLILMPLTYLTIFLSLWRQMQVYESSRQMELQHQNYDVIHQKMELGRFYRHDMRHHLSILDEMLQQGDIGTAQQYIEELGGNLSRLTQTIWCANTAVNAVLTTYIAQAEESGCRVDTDIQIPSELPYSEMDVCIALSNALENAIHACRNLKSAERRIRLKLELTDNRRLLLSMDNACPAPVLFGADGLPSVPHQGEHGLGLRSIQSMVRKYDGLFRCWWDSGRFFLQIVLFPPDGGSSAGSA